MKDRVGSLLCLFRRQVEPTRLEMSKSVSGIPMLLEVLVQGLPMFADIRLRMVREILLSVLSFT